MIVQLRLTWQEDNVPVKAGTEWVQSWLERRIQLLNVPASHQTPNKLYPKAHINQDDLNQ